MSEAMFTVQDVVQKLVSILKAEGPILLAQVPVKLKPIDYHQFTTGKLKTWLCEFPEFALSEDGQSIVLSAEKDAVSASAPAPVQAPAVLPEVRCMHNFAYMNFWAQNLKRLKNLGEFPGLMADNLRDLLGHQLMQHLLLGQMKVIVSEDQQPYLVMDTGLHTPDKYTVYAVMGINPANTDGTKQFWAMKGFCSDSENDQSELGRWFRAHVSGGRTFDHTKLSEQLDDISAQKDALCAAASQFLRTLEEGGCPELTEEGRLSRLLAQYESQWEDLLSFLDTYPGIKQENTVSISGLRAAANQESFRDSLLWQALDLFKSIALGLRSFFAEYGWDAGETCTPMQDLSELEKICNSALLDITAIEEFEKTMDAYRAFRDAVSASKADETYYANVTAAADHFSELPQFRVAAKMLRGTPAEERAFLDQIDEIEPLLNQYRTIQAEAMAKENTILPDSNLELLRIALQGDQKYLRNWVQYVKEALPEQPSLRDIIVPGAQDPDAELTCSAVAARLQAANCPDQAERYWILGLQFEQTLCATQLLKFYRETEQEEAFALLWARFHEQIAYSPLDEAFWFSTVCQRDPEQAIRMGQENIHLQYQPDYLTSLILAAERLGQEEMAETFRMRLERFQIHTEPNPFEAAVIADDRGQILALSTSESLQDMGYDAQQIQVIRNTVQTSEYPAGTSPYDVGSRLYAFQGNFHTLAEQWLWKGVSKQNRGSYGVLLLLLANERRWTEAIGLYAHHAESQKRFEDCRRLYLIAHYYNSPAKAQGIFTENLQDALSILNTMPSFRGKFGITAQQEEYELYTLLLKLHTATTANPYLWSVICEDRSLRDQVGDEALLASMGLNVAATSEAYRSGSYPHGRDAASVALRLYALAGNFAGGAETAALIAENDPAARKLLWTIYQQQKNETGLYTLLSEDAALRQENYSQYLTLVFARGEFETFLTLLEESGDLSEQQLLQRAIAELNLGRPMTDSAEVCAEAAVACQPEVCLELLRAAKSQENVATEVICTCFEQWLTLPAKQLQDLVTCNATATMQQLVQLQNIALQRQNMPLVVYLYNVMKIGDVQDAAQQLYGQLLGEMTASGQLQAECMQKLHNLYPDRTEELSMQAISVSIRTILLQDQDADVQQTAEKLATAIEMLKGNPATFEQLLQALRGSKYCHEPRVYTAIRNYAKQVGRPTDGLLFLHGERNTAGENLPFRDHLINLYWNALVENRFPMQIASEAEEVCFLRLEQKDPVMAAVTIAMLRQLAGQPVYAYALLGHLAEVTDSQASLAQYISNMLGIDQLPATLRLPDPLPDYVELFEQILDMGSEEQVFDYLNFCGKFVHLNDTPSRILQSLQGSDELTEQESVLALQLLCNNYRYRGYWELCYRIPFNVTDIGRAVFLQLYCQNVPCHWKEYVQLCETLPTERKRLSNALRDWCLAKGYKEHEEFRQYVEGKLDHDPSYLEDLDDPENIYRIVETVCLKGKPTNGWQTHAQLHAVTKIAVHSGSAAALKILEEKMGNLLFGTKGDLGVAVLCNLLLSGRFEEAQNWLKRLNDSVNTLSCHSLVEKLSGYQDEALHDWAQEPTNRRLLELFLPNGTPPAYDRVDRIVCDAFLEGDEKETAIVLQKLLQLLPNDYATTYELFELCKTGFEGSLPIMHQCLVSLVRLTCDHDNNAAILRFSDRDQQTHQMALAALNRVIIHEQNMDSIDDGWDFGRPTAQQLADKNILDFDSVKVLTIEQKVEDSLSRRRPDISALRVKAWIANITGDWTDYLAEAYKKHGLAEVEEVFFPNETISYMGFAQSILRLIARTDPAQIPNLLEWIKKLPLKETRPDHWNRQRNWALAFYKEGHLAQVQQLGTELTDQLLRLPVDNGRLCSHLLSLLLEPQLSKTLEQIRAVATMICFLGGRYTMFLMYGQANSCLENGQYGAAGALFQSLYQVSDLWDTTHSMNNNFARLQKAKAYNYEREEYLCKIWVCGVFCGDADYRAELRNPELEPWTIINLLLCVTSVCFDKLDNLTECMDPQNQYFAEQVLKLLNKNIDDEAKMAILEDPALTLLQCYYLSQMLAFHNSSSKKPQYLRREQMRKKAMDANNGIYRAYTAGDPERKRDCQDKNMLYKLQPVLDLQVPQALASGETLTKVPASGEAKDQAAQETIQDVEDTPKVSEAEPSYPDPKTEQEPVHVETCVYVAPDYVSHLEPLDVDPQELLNLQKQYQMKTSVTAKMEIAQKIYCHMIGANESASKCYCALLQYSVNRFYVLYREDTESSRRQAFDLLISLLETDNCNVKGGPEHKAWMDLINPVGVTGLIRSYGKIRDLAEAYAAHTAAFTRLRTLVTDKMILRNLEVLYNVLRGLGRDYERFGSADTEKLISSLNAASRQFSAMNSIGNIKTHLRRIIEAELAVLTRRPNLEVKLLNQGVQAYNGVLTGLVINKGRVAAEGLTLQAFCDAFSSGPYALHQLQPGEKAIFEIPYTCDEKQTRLAGNLSLTVDAEENVDANCEISLVLGPTSGDKLPFTAYSPDRAAFVFDQKKGEVRSNGFFGRKAETEKLRELVAGDHFADFHSAIVYGVRRTGKTYLLEYFKTYVQHTHPECICIRIDVQGSNETIHGVFVECVLNNDVVKAALADCRDTDTFLKKWGVRPAEGSEMDPNLIKVFYQELFDLTGKGIFLLIDETDRLFKKLEDEHEPKVLSNLLRTISGLLDDDERKKYLQLIICGSNQLMYYASVGRDMQQLFQRVGDYKLSVGRMPKEDALAVLNSVDIPYAEGTPEMIWEFTDGLVWFVKLLANAAVRRAKKAGRSCVYPADVFYSLPDVVCKQNCEQFYEGCQPGSAERQMIDAMQSIAYRKDRYVSLAEVGERMGMDPPAVEKTMDQLKYFEIAERHQADSNRVRFTLDIYRRYFRSLYSAYPRVAEETIVFEPMNDTEGAVSYTEADALYADDDEL